MDKSVSFGVFTSVLISLFFLLGCSRIESIFKTKKYVTFGEFDYAIYGRHEAANGYIGFSSAGVSITFMQEEENIGIWMEDIPADPSNGGNWMNVVIADSVYSRIKLKKGKHLYQLTLPIYNKFISLVKVTESFVGEVRIYGLETSRPPRTLVGVNLPRRIQFIGNSITCGYGNMVSIAAPPQGNPLTGFHSENENAYLSYAMQTARKLKMEPTLICFSGKGVYRNFDGDTNETMPKIYDRIHLHDKKSKLWDSWMPQNIIVINLGTNDYYGESQNKPLNDSVFVGTYIKFVEKLVGLYPYTKIICANGSMLNDGWPEGKKCWSRIQTNLKNVQEHFQAKGNTNIYTFFFTPQSAPYGEDYHPSLATHTKMAEELTTFIQTVVNK